MRHTDVTAPPCWPSRPPGFFSKLKGDVERKRKDAHSQESKAKRAFKATDRDGNGFLDHEEMRTLAVSLGVSDQQSIQQAIGEMDTDGDGEISLLEFMTWWRLNLQSETNSGECSNCLCACVVRRA